MKSLKSNIDSRFLKKYEKIKSYFFSRNPKYWSCFNDPILKGIIDFRKHHYPDNEKLEKYKDGGTLLKALKNDINMPAKFSTPNTNRTSNMLEFVGALSKEWENPASVENVITMPCDPAIYGAFAGVISNPNLIYEDYAGIASELEKNVIKKIANLSGYDPENATGIFTQGGTFCNLYGYLMGIRKSLPNVRENGMGFNHDYRIINSQGGHYSNITNLSLLGVDIKKKTIRIKLNENNDIDLKDLENHLKACFQIHCVVPAILLTMGTTDTFAVDRVKPVRDLVDKLCSAYDIKIKPHIHVDAAIGWSILFFLNYNFKNNPLSINSITLKGIMRNVERFKEIKYADSFTVDFHKWGYVPYTSSLVMFKNKDDMKYLQNDPENFSYFEPDIQGHTHLQSTIECSRGAIGLFGAFSALEYMGIEGYQLIIAHCLQNANYFREKLRGSGNAEIMAPENQGPSVAFRLYNPKNNSNPTEEFKKEICKSHSKESLKRLQGNTYWHRQRFLNRKKEGLFTNWIEFMAHTNYDQKGNFLKIPGEKAVFMNPLTTYKDIDTFINNL